MENSFQDLRTYLATLGLSPNQSSTIDKLLANLEKRMRILEFNNERTALQKRSLTALLNQTAVDLQTALQDLNEERRKSEKLLLNILPQMVAERLKGGDESIVDNFGEVSLLFADIVDFTPLSTSITPSKIVDWLNHIFSEFDQIATKLGLEKIKTVGDSYMAASGLPVPRPDHAEAIAEMALQAMQVSHQICRPDGKPLLLRIGIHCGPVTAGVIGRKKFSYDLWGDTVNTASRMETYSQNGRI